MSAQFEADGYAVRHIGEFLIRLSQLSRETNVAILTGISQVQVAHGDGTGLTLAYEQGRGYYIDEWVRG